MLSELPNYDGLAQLSPDELRSIMPVKSGSTPEALVDQGLRRVFLYAIQSCSSDVHISGRGSHDRMAVKISVRTPAGLENYTYDGEAGRQFMDKMFALTNTPQGGSTAPIISTRFSIDLPAHFAASLGLSPRGDAPYALDVRVEFIRTYDGWKFVCRLLDQQRTPKFDGLGLSQTLAAAIRAAVKRPSGLFLVSGPTGSGKSTSMKAILDLLNDGMKAISTIEDPVEYRLLGTGPIAQIQVTREMTFPIALRSVLRQDPEVIFVGEIRDEETMRTALAAAQTGHIVLATIHANSAPETITRALELTGSTDPRYAHVLADVLCFVAAQRLVNTYGGQPKRRDLQADEAAWLAVNGMGFMKLIDEPGTNSVLGKLPLIEGIEITPDIKALIRSQQLSSGGIYRLACHQPQFETLAMAGVRAVESKGAKLRDCMVGLETTADAQEYPALRLQAARSHKTSLSVVSDAIDRQAEAVQQGEVVSLGDCIDSIAAATWETA